MHIAKHVIEGRQICFAIANSDDYIQNYHCNGQFYEHGHLKIIRSLCRPDRAFVDIGANVGNHTLYVSQFCDVSKVVPFECNPEALEVLRMTLGVNDCRNVDTRYIGLALGAIPGAARIKSSAENNLGGTQIEYGLDGEIQVVNGDSLLLDEPVGVVKIDVELTEFEVLTGLAQTVARWRPSIMVEVVPEKHPQLEEWAEEHDYRIEMKGWDNLLIPSEDSPYQWQS